MDVVSGGGGSYYIHLSMNIDVIIIIIITKISLMSKWICSTNSNIFMINNYNNNNNVINRYQVFT